MPQSPEATVIEGMFRIADKEGHDVDFTLNSAQRHVDEHLTGRDIIPKARQEGVSSYFLARYTAACLGRRNTSAVVISHEKLATERMLEKVHYYIKNIRGVRATVGVSAKNELTFPKTGSKFFIGTAGARKFGRGDTITHLHCSEAAFWDDPKVLTAGLFQAVPRSGEIAIESTGNGVGNWYHNYCMRASKGVSNYNLIFLPFHTFEEYRDPLTPKQEIELLSGLKEEWEEQALLSAGVQPGFLAFRRRKLDEMDYDLGLFKQEYPMELSECFQMAGSGIFTKVNYTPTTTWRQDPDDRFLHVLDGHPSTYLTYIIGADVAAGLGQTKQDSDSSCAEIFCLDTGEQVGEWISNLVAPDSFARICARLGHRFNKAFIVPELNNHGILTVSELKKTYPKALIYRNKRPSKTGSDVEAQRDHVTFYGWQTRGGSGPQSRFAAIGRLREFLASVWTIHSPVLYAELSTFIENPDTGKLEAAGGCHDDTVIASMCAVMGQGQAARRTMGQKPRVAETGTDPFSLEEIIDGLRQGDDAFPIPSQAQV